MPTAKFLGGLDNIFAPPFIEGSFTLIIVIIIAEHFRFPQNCHFVFFVSLRNLVSVSGDPQSGT